MSLQLAGLSWEYLCSMCLPSSSWDCGLAWVCPSEGSRSSMREQTQICKPFSNVCLSHIRYHRPGQSTAVSSERRRRRYLPPTMRRALQSHMAKSMDAGRCDELGGIDTTCHWGQRQTLTSSPLHLLFPLPGTSSLQL
uniref:Uncharacterized protein n=1 Tax=Myotis myotis TaxID=51298 RepID=A0A7J8ANF8_MYOMY|nr:hypothetical protein mMyoMyo1_008193 [Myotis myotis]